MGRRSKGLMPVSGIGKEKSGNEKRRKRKLEEAQAKRQGNPMDKFVRKIPRNENQSSQIALDNDVDESDSNSDSNDDSTSPPALLHSESNLNASDGVLPSSSGTSHSQFIPVRFLISRSFLFANKLNVRFVDRMNWNTGQSSQTL